MTNLESIFFEIIPTGEYHVQIVSSEMCETKSGNGRCLGLELVVMDGPYAGARLLERLDFSNPDEEAIEITHRTLSAICHATGQMAPTDSELFHHRSMIATVEVRQAGPDENGVMRETANKIGRYQPMNDYTSQQIAVTIQ